MNLQEQYEEVVMAYIKLFEEKQEMDFEYWVADIVGEVASFGCVYFYEFSVIKLDIDLDIPKGIIIDWLNYTIDSEITVNYWSYLLNKGLIKK